jgi:hypothetical protein
LGGAPLSKTPSFQTGKEAARRKTKMMEEVEETRQIIWRVAKVVDIGRAATGRCLHSQKQRPGREVGL